MQVYTNGSYPNTDVEFKKKDKHVAENADAETEEPKGEE